MNDRRLARRLGIRSSEVERRRMRQRDRAEAIAELGLEPEAEHALPEERYGATTGELVGLVRERKAAAVKAIYADSILF